MNKTKGASGFDFGSVIYSYTRSNAIEDGVLIDVTEMAREAGIVFPVAVTRAVYDRYVDVDSERNHCQDPDGRLWDILWMFAHHVRRAIITGSVGLYELIVAVPKGTRMTPNESPFDTEMEKRTVTLKSVCGPDDEGMPCITIMMPDED